MASASVAVLALSMLPHLACHAAESFVEPLKAGDSIKLYDAPHGPASANSAGPSDMPLRVEGDAKNGFYPVRVGNKQYWVDGMDIKMRRDNRAACNASSTVHAAGQLGAATNRCQ